MLSINLRVTNVSCMCIFSVTPQNALASVPAVTASTLSTTPTTTTAKITTPTTVKSTPTPTGKNLSYYSFEHEVVVLFLAVILVVVFHFFQLLFLFV